MWNVVLISLLIVDMSAYTYKVRPHALSEVAVGALKKAHIYALCT